jgi:hypothetical protein
MLFFIMHEGIKWRTRMEYKNSNNLDQDKFQRQFTKLMKDFDKTEAEILSQPKPITIETIDDGELSTLSQHERLLYIRKARSKLLDAA